MNHLGFNLRQKGLHYHDSPLKGSTSLLAFRILPKTLSTHALEKSQVLYLSLQKICPPVCSSQSLHNFAHVHHISKWIKWNTWLELCLSWSQYLFVRFFLCQLDSRYFCFLLFVLLSSILSRTSSTFKPLLRSSEVSHYQNYNFLHFLAKNSDLYVLSRYDEVLWLRCSFFQLKINSFFTLSNSAIS